MELSERNPAPSGVMQAVHARKQPLKRIAWKSIAACIFCLGLFVAAIPFSSAQQPPAEPQPGLPGPVPLPHLYWHFLIYQSQFDAQAAAVEAQGGDGTWMRNHLQIRMGFSDADFAPIRDSAQRLSSELAALDAQAATIVAAGDPSTTAAQLQALDDQREAYINAEISTLKQALSPERITAFETFITQFYAPNPQTIQTTPPPGQTAPTEVQP
jgi:hypothetical protein